MNTQTVCRICKMEGVRLHCMTNTCPQQMYERDSGVTGTSLPNEDRKPLLACISCCDRLQHCHQVRDSGEQREMHSNTGTCAIPPVEHHSNTCAVQSDEHKCIKTEPERLIEIEVKQECMSNDAADDTWQQNDASLAEDNGNADSGVMPGISTVKSEHKIEIEIQLNDMSANETQAPRRLTASQSAEDTSLYDKYKTSREQVSRHEVTLCNYNNRARQSQHIVHEQISFSSYSIPNVMSASPGNKRFECDTCNKHFKVKSNLLRHLSIHSGEKPYQCDMCNKLFTQKSDLVKHSRIHTGEKPYKCNICNKSFSQKGNLATHHTHVHTGYKPYKCNICSKCFSEKSNLIAHNRIHTGDKPNKCNICSKCFTQKNDLVKHIRSHTGEKPYECNVCGKCFTEKSKLVRHYRIHTGEKPYECNVCSKRFNQKSSLVAHNRVHTDC